jgi:hypothetical protein
LANHADSGAKTAVDDLAKTTGDATLALPLQLQVTSAGGFPAAWAGQPGGKMTLKSQAFAGHHPTAFAEVELVTDDGATIAGILVAEFDKEADKLERLLLFRAFVDEPEKATVVKQ